MPPKRQKGRLSADGRLYRADIWIQIFGNTIRGMMRRARIRAFLLGLLIGGGSWTAAAHDDAASTKAPCEGVVADCPSEAVTDAADDDQTLAQTDSGEADGPTPSTSTAAGLPVSRPPLVQTDGKVRARAFADHIDASIGPIMSGTPPLGLLSGSS